MSDDFDDLYAYNPLDPGARGIPKPNLGAVWPPGAIDSDFVRTEPLLTPELLVQRHLFGIPLVSNIIDPITGLPQRITPEMLRDIIAGAVCDAELDAHIDIMPVLRQEKSAFDRAEFARFGYFKMRHRPIQSIDKLSFTPSSEIDIFVIPTSWISTAQLYRGRIQIIPLIPATAASSSGYTGAILPPGQGGAGLFLGLIAAHHWIPDFMQTIYTTGFPDGMVPRPINDLVGSIAAMKVLSLLAATHARSTSHSLGIDGMSQSISGPGPSLYNERIALLDADRQKIAKKIRKTFGQKLFSGTV